MGAIKNVLAEKDFDFKSYFNDDLRLEISESIHLHYRDMRMLMTPEQFNHFLVGINKGSLKWDGGVADKDILLKNEKLKGEQIFERVVSIEEQENGCFHFHYRDMRLELDERSFVGICDLFEEAKQNYLIHNLCKCTLDSIDPYDHIHFASREEWLNIKGYSQEHLTADYEDHLEGVQWMANKIDKGFVIMPIVVTATGKDLFLRRDGFKRYMAYKVLCRTEIPCYVVSEEIALTCFQNKKFPFIGFDHG